MKLQTTFAIGAVLAAAALAACGGDDTNGGTAGGGGSANTGGGGSANTGGGGSANTGGGGSANTGGGGSANTGGSSGGISDAGSDACTCTGASCTPAGPLFTFDAADAGGGAAAWDFYPPPSADGAGLVPTKVISDADGKTAPGALVVTVPYTDFGQGPVSIQHNFGSTPGSGGALDWSCKSAVHVFVKVVSPGDGGSVIPFINGVQAYIQSGDPNPDAAAGGGYSRYTATFVNGSMFADGVFHEIVVPFGTGAMAVNPTDVNQIGVQVLPIAAAPDGGTEGGTVSPGTVQLVIDDFSLQ